MFCQECGAKNDDASAFCESCGSKLEKEAVASSPVVHKAPVIDKKMDRLLVVMAIEVILIIAVGYMISSIGKASFGSERVASNYFVHLVNGEYKEAYQFMDVKESVFINEEMFVKSRTGNQFGDVGRFIIKQDDALKNMFGTSEQGLGRDVTITYRTTGSERDQSYVVPMSPSVDKGMFFFDTWKVGTESIICNDYVFYIPKGAQLSIDGVVLDDTYIAKDEEEGWYYGNEYDTYRIPAIFCGKHEVLVTVEDREDFKKTINIEKTDMYYFVEEQNYKPEVVEELMQLAAKDMQTIFNAMFEGKKRNSLEGIFTSDADYLEDIDYKYEYMQSQLFESDYYRNYKADIYNVEASGWNDSTRIRISFDCNVDYQRYDYWYSEWENASYNMTDQSMEFNFVKENGKWVLNNLQYLEFLY